jgi:hypothetical protein
MKRMIKRTEITIETVEITTTRHTRRETDNGVPSGSETPNPVRTLSGSAHLGETVIENGIEEKKNEKAI